MRIKMLRNLGREWPQQLKLDEIADVDDATGQALIAKGLAEPAKNEALTKKAEPVPTAPATPGNIGDNPHGPVRKSNQ